MHLYSERKEQTIFAFLQIKVNIFIVHICVSLKTITKQSNMVTYVQTHLITDI